jgi:UDP-N-acetylglucosamine 2-epimerase (non-hydrolysing)
MTSRFYLDLIYCHYTLGGRDTYYNLVSSYVSELTSVVYINTPSKKDFYQISDQSMATELQNSNPFNDIHCPVDPYAQLHSHPMLKILIVFGTRSEAIKLAPLIKEFAREATFNTKICVTGQHRELLDHVLAFFKITPDYDLNLMAPNQSLFDITSKALAGLKGVIEDFQPDNILVHGDTTTAMVGALAAFYLQKEVIHIEAGLRSRSMRSPFPEEGNRRIVSQLAQFHFTPSTMATENLRSEHIVHHVYQVGNTGIDAILLGLEILGSQVESDSHACLDGVDINKRIILITSHRRENFGQPLVDICSAMRDIAEEFPDVEVVYPVHPNPNVRGMTAKMLKEISNIKLIEALSYPHFIWLMSRAYLVITDSGGIQEEALAMGKPLLVLRDVTDRTEGVFMGTSILVGSDRDKINIETKRLLVDMAHYSRMAQSASPYGDGTTSQKIVSILKGIYALQENTSCQKCNAGLS